MDQGVHNGITDGRKGHEDGGNHRLRNDLMSTMDNAGIPILSVHIIVQSITPFISGDVIHAPTAIVVVMVIAIILSVLSI